MLKGFLGLGLGAVIGCRLKYGFGGLRDLAYIRV